MRSPGGSRLAQGDAPSVPASVPEPARGLPNQMAGHPQRRRSAGVAEWWIPGRRLWSASLAGTGSHSLSPSNAAFNGAIRFFFFWDWQRDACDRERRESVSLRVALNPWPYTVHCPAGFCAVSGALYLHLHVQMELASSDIPTLTWPSTRWVWHMAGKLVSDGGYDREKEVAA
jgi:hypothetical protein